jgi:hypothetical protein
MKFCPHCGVSLQTEEAWKRGSFDIVCQDDTLSVKGYVWNGIGLHRVSERWRGNWYRITHIPSGLSIGTVGGFDRAKEYAQMFVVANIGKLTAKQCGEPGVLAILRCIRAAWLAEYSTPTQQSTD